MRTDSTAMSKTAAGAVRALVRKSFGADWLPRRPRVSRVRARNAQEAHEAIRPTDFSLMPEALEGRIGEEEAALHALIWNRAVASQMAAARLHRVRAELATEAGDVVLSASGSSPLFDGFFRIYREGPDEDAEPAHDRPLPAVREGERVFVSEVRPRAAFHPPPRALHRGWPGAPAGGARHRPALDLRRHRRRAQGARLRGGAQPLLRVGGAGPGSDGVPGALVRAGVAYGSTDEMERDLDRIARGEAAWKGVLHGFWGAFEAALEEAGALGRAEVRAALGDALDAWPLGPAGEAGARSCPSCAEGTLTLKFGRHGAFVGCSAFPRCRYRRPLARGLPPGRMRSLAVRAV